MLASFRFITFMISSRLIEKSTGNLMHSFASSMKRRSFFFQFMCLDEKHIIICVFPLASFDVMKLLKEIFLSRSLCCTISISLCGRAREGVCSYSVSRR